MSRRNARFSSGAARSANTPPVTDDLALYFDPEYAAGITNISNATQDLRSRVGGHSVSAAGGVNRPAHGLTMNGRLAWTFDGTQSVLGNTASTFAPLLNGAQAYSFYSVVDYDNTDQRNIIGTSDITGAAGSFLHHGLLSAAGGDYYVRAAVPGAGTTNTGAGPSLTVPAVYSAVFTGTTVTTRWNSAVQINAGANVRALASQTQLAFGALVLAGGFAFLWQGKIAKTLVYLGAHDAATEASVTSYLRGFYGI